MILKLYTQDSCTKCPLAKALAKELEGIIPIEQHDVKTAEGLSDALEYDVMATPSFVLLNDRGRVLETWRGETPTKDTILRYLK